MGIMIFSLMFAVGCSLNFKDFNKELKQPKSYLVGVFSQFILMPLLGFLIYKSFGLSFEIGLALILVCCAPGGSTSNLFSFFSKGNVVLSVCLTVTTTFLCVLLMPIMLWLYLDFETARVQIPFVKMFGALGASLLPILLGMFLRHKYSSKAKFAELWANRFGHLMILIMVAIWIPKLKNAIDLSNIKTYGAIYLLCFLGMMLGLLMAKIFKCSKEDARSISLEVGIQNAPLAFAILGLSFGKDLLQGVGWVCLVYGAFSFSNAINLSLFFRLRDFQKLRG